MARDEYERGGVVLPAAGSTAQLKRKLRNATNAIHAAGRAAADSFFDRYCDRNATWPAFREALDSWSSDTHAANTLPEGGAGALEFVLAHRRTPHAPDWWEDQLYARNPAPHRRVTNAELAKLFPLATSRTREFDIGCGTIVVHDRRIGWNAEGNHCLEEIEHHPVYRALIDGLDKTTWTSRSGGASSRTDEYDLETYGHTGGWTLHSSWGGLGTDNG